MQYCSEDKSIEVEKEDAKNEDLFGDFRELTPKEIVKELGKHIIGQDDAKKTVAIALRNRWRRLQLSPELQLEITPKNILMIGPTGCGK